MVGMLQQVLSLLDVVSVSSILKLVKTLVAPRPVVKSNSKESVHVEDMDIDGNEEESVVTSSKSALSECTIIINNLADLFEYFGVRDQADIIRVVIETLTQITRECTGGTSLFMKKYRVSPASFYCTVVKTEMTDMLLLV